MLNILYQYNYIIFIVLVILLCVLYDYLHYFNFSLEKDFSKYIKNLKNKSIILEGETLTIKANPWIITIIFYLVAALLFLTISFFAPAKNIEYLFKFCGLILGVYLFYLAITKIKLRIENPNLIIINSQGISFKNNGCSWRNVDKLKVYDTYNKKYGKVKLPLKI